MKTIAEKNRIIAEFMGVEKHIDKLGYNRWNYHKNNVWLFDRGLDYHTSWDWLMPVVEEIESMNYTSEMVFIPTVHRLWFFSAGVKIVEGKGQTKKQATYNAVVQFIEWYNENK